MAALRRLLLGLLLFGLAGTATELLLIGHHEDAWQMIPLMMIGLAAPSSPPMKRRCMTEPFNGMGRSSS